MRTKPGPRQKANFLVDSFLLTEENIGFEWWTLLSSAGDESDLTRLGFVNRLLKFRFHTLAVIVFLNRAQGLWSR
jgi:hypothetical protein